MMVPPALTIWDAAAPDESLAFALVGAVVLSRKELKDERG